MSAGGDGGGSNSPSRTFSRRPLRACPMVCRRPPGRPSAASRTVQPRAPGSGLGSGHVTLAGAASPLHDASTARGEEAASTLTLPPKRRGREQAGGCQLLRFAACLARPDGTSARVLRGSCPVETTHPHAGRRSPGSPILRSTTRSDKGASGPHATAHGARRPAGDPARGARRARRSPGGDRAAACPARGRARSWRAPCR